MQWGNFTVNRRGLRSLTMVTTSHNSCADLLTDDERRAFSEITRKWICCIRYCILQICVQLYDQLCQFSLAFANHPPRETTLGYRGDLADATLLADATFLLITQRPSLPLRYKRYHPILWNEIFPIVTTKTG